MLVGYNIDKNNIIIKSYEGDVLNEEIVELKYVDKFEYDMDNPPSFNFKFTILD